MDTISSSNILIKIDAEVPFQYRELLFDLELPNQKVVSILNLLNEFKLLLEKNIPDDELFQVGPEFCWFQKFFKFK